MEETFGFSPQNPIFNQLPGRMARNAQGQLSSPFRHIWRTQSRLPEPAAFLALFKTGNEDVTGKFEFHFVI
jgi:hypothetical protein